MTTFNRPRSPVSIPAGNTITTTPAGTTTGVYRYFWQGEPGIRRVFVEDLNPQENKFIPIIDEYGVSGVINYLFCVYENDASDQDETYGIRVTIDGAAVYAQSKIPCAIETESMVAPVGIAIYQHTLDDMRVLTPTPILFRRDLRVEVIASNYLPGSVGNRKRMILAYDYLVTGQGRT